MVVEGQDGTPQKEKIKMLESLYKQGLRTPTVDQIQQITARLRDFGHIEGKNVFYWFQNHKAKQRQKQKQNQDNQSAYFNRFIHPTPVFQPYHNFVRNPPCYNNMSPPKNIDPGFYHQYPKTAAGGNYKRSRLLITPDQATINDQAIEMQRSNHQQTLDLFPVHRTGVLKAKNRIIGTENHDNIEGMKFISANTSSSSENDNDCYI